MEAKDKITEDYDFYIAQLLSHLDLEDRLIVCKLLQENYRNGFLNGMAIRPVEINTNQNILL